MYLGTLTLTFMIDRIYIITFSSTIASLSYSTIVFGGELLEVNILHHRGKEHTALI